MTIRHFLLTDDGHIEEYSESEASRVAEGTRLLPRYADARVRYVQVAFDEEPEDGEIRVRTLGAVIGFDEHGRIDEAAAPADESESVSEFEHDACVKFALRERIPEATTIN